MIDSVYIYTIPRLGDRHLACSKELVDAGVPKEKIGLFFGPDRLHFEDIVDIKRHACAEFHQFSGINDDNYLKGYTAQAWGYCQLLKHVAAGDEVVLLIQDRRMLQQTFQQITDWVEQLAELEPDWTMLTLIQGESKPVPGTPFMRKKSMGAQDWGQVFTPKGANRILHGFLQWISALGKNPPTYESYVCLRDDIFYLNTYCTTLLPDIKQYPSALHVEEVVDRHTVKAVEPLL